MSWIPEVYANKSSSQPAQIKSQDFEMTVLGESSAVLKVEKWLTCIRAKSKWKYTNSGFEDKFLLILGRWLWNTFQSRIPFFIYFHSENFFSFYIKCISCILWKINPTEEEKTAEGFLSIKYHLLFGDPVALSETIKILGCAKMRICLLPTLVSSILTIVFIMASAFNILYRRS